MGSIILLATYADSFPPCMQLTDVSTDSLKNVGSIRYHTTVQTIWRCCIGAVAVETDCSISSSFIVKRISTGLGWDSCPLGKEPLPNSSLTTWLLVSDTLKSWWVFKLISPSDFSVLNDAVISIHYSIKRQEHTCCVRARSWSKRQLAIIVPYS